MWFTIFQQAAGETEPEAQVETEAVAQAEAPLGEAGEGLGTVSEAVMEPLQQEVAAPRGADAIEALTETTERATEAATEFVGWVGSGQGSGRCPGWWGCGW